MRKGLFTHQPIVEDFGTAGGDGWGVRGGNLSSTKCQNKANTSDWTLCNLKANMSILTEDMIKTALNACK